MIKVLFAAVLLVVSLIGWPQHVIARELHVSTQGSDGGDGSPGRPYRTISAAARVAEPGDTITVQAGIYRERINPPRGGTSDDKRIVYQAAPGAKVEIAGSEQVMHWDRVQGDLWKTMRPNTFFGKFNPYSDLIRGDWFDPGGRPHHTGAVYIDGKWLPEAASLDEVKDPSLARTAGYLLNVAAIRLQAGGADVGQLAADRFTDKSGMQTAPCSEGGQCLGYIEDGNWARYEHVDFGQGVDTVSMRVAAVDIGGRIELRRGSPTGTLLGVCSVPPTGGWQTWITRTAKITPTRGLQTLCLVCRGPAAHGGRWFGQVDAKNTTLWARFPGRDPNTRCTEINVRQTVFYPEKPGRNYITVRGFVLRDAATPWAPPTAEQVGVIGTNWSKGWIIENNVVRHSACSGITLGKYGDQYDNKSASSAEGYVQTIERATAHGWNRDTIGHHLVRNNTISECEQTGICGSLGGVFSRIVGNDIHDIYVQRLYSGAEMAGIKLHAAIDVLIKNNRIHHTDRAMWMDWMAQGTRISGNLCYGNDAQDLFVEVDHGPYLVDNNLFLSRNSVWDMSEGGAYVQNLFGGALVWQPDPGRATPFMQPHSTAVVRLAKFTDTDNRFYNNVFLGAPLRGNPPQGLCVYDQATHLLHTGGNVYWGNARPYVHETDATVEPDFHPALTLTDSATGMRLSMTADHALAASGHAPVTTARLGKTETSEAAYENPDGSALTVDTDYFGNLRRNTHTPAGPFAEIHAGTFKTWVWRPAPVGGTRYSPRSRTEQRNPSSSAPRKTPRSMSYHRAHSRLSFFTATSAREGKDSCLKPA